LVDRIGQQLVAQVQPKADYPFEFHLLADEDLINAFALPGGQVFITAALFKKMKSEDALAGVLGHEVGHVVARHSAEQMAKAGLLQGIGMAAGTVMSEGGSNRQVAGMVNAALSTRYGRQDEYHSDEIGAILMHRAGYDPRALLEVMEVLKASGGSDQPEMLSSHPFPENRIERLKREVLPRLMGTP
jgi:predicted Zn-dependent protease